MVSKKVICFFVLFSGYLSLVGMRLLSEREEAEYNYRRNIHNLRDIIARNDHVALAKEIKSYSSFVKDARFDELEKSALHVAAQDDSIKCLKILVEHIDANILTKHGRLPLHYARSVEAVSMLVRHCHWASRNVQDESGETPFFSLLKDESIPESERFSMALLLFQWGTDIDVAERWGKYTPLHRAVITKRPKMVDFLLRYGADPDVKNKQKKTAFDLSIEVADKAITLIFEKHGMLFFPLKEKKIKSFYDTDSRCQKTRF
jgi:ankyrin repeat protein